MLLRVPTGVDLEFKVVQFHNRESLTLVNHLLAQYLGSCCCLRRHAKAELPAVLELLVWFVVPVRLGGERQADFGKSDLRFVVTKGRGNIRPQGVELGAIKQRKSARGAGGRAGLARLWSWWCLVGDGDGDRGHEGDILIDT